MLADTNLSILYLPVFSFCLSVRLSVWLSVSWSMCSPSFLSPKRLTRHAPNHVPPLLVHSLPLFPRPPSSFLPSTGLWGRKRSNADSGRRDILERNEREAKTNNHKEVHVSSSSYPSTSFPPASFRPSCPKSLPPASLLHSPSISFPLWRRLERRYNMERG